MTLYRHKELEDIYEGPASARSMLAQSGWAPLSDAETEEYYQARDREALDLDEAMQVTANLDPSVARLEPGEPEGNSRKEDRKEDTGE